MSAGWKLRRLFTLLCCCASGLSGAGCLVPGVWPLDDDDDDDIASPAPSGPPQGEFAGGGSSLPPSVDAVSIPDWPPIGPYGGLSTSVTAPAGLHWIDFDFANEVTYFLSGQSAEVSVTGEELGEGFGTLSIRVFDVDGRHATRAVTDLLVDLTPPKADLGKTVLRATGDHLEIWVSDAWVLGAATLTFQGATEQHVFDPVYPATLGETWDYSLVKFAADDLPQGKAAAELVVTDAAGNTSSTTFELTVDGTAPAVSIQQPTAGATVSGAFDLEVFASDAEGGAVWLDIEIDGAPVATGVGPAATIALAAGELDPGATTIVVRARDEAGNEAVETVAIVVE